MSRPLMIDFYCCQGGASAGFRAAGFDVVGSDLAAQPRYPFPFIQADALALMRQVIDDGMKIEVPGQGWRQVRALAGSPPCQRRSRAQKIQGREHPALIAPTRALFREAGVPWVIENVPADGPDDDPMIDPVMLCGQMFGLRTYRHRLFESNLVLTAPAHEPHLERQVKMGRPVAEGEFYQAVGNFSNVGYARRDMGVAWMTREGIRECIPPAYAEHVGRQLMESVR